MFSNQRLHVSKCFQIRRYYIKTSISGFSLQNRRSSNTRCISCRATISWRVAAASVDKPRLLRFFSGPATFSYMPNTEVKASFHPEVVHQHQACRGRKVLFCIYVSSKVGKQKIDQEGRVCPEKWKRTFSLWKGRVFLCILICTQNVSVSKEHFFCTKRSFFLCPAHFTRLCYVTCLEFCRP